MAEAVVLSPGGGFVRMCLCVRFGSLFFFRYGMNVPQMIVKAMTSSGVWGADRVSFVATCVKNNA